MDDAPNSWPTTDEIEMASERPMLTVLDTALELTSRTLIAEHGVIHTRTPCRWTREPPTPSEALAISIMVLATSLRESIASYLSMLDELERGHRRARTTADRGDPHSRNDLPF